MRIANHITSGRISPKPPFWLRITLLVAMALAMATAIAAGTTDAPYEDRLVDLALRQSHAAQWDSFAAQPSAVKALLLDYDPEMAFKAQLAIEKYGDDARDALLRFGDDPSFQEVIRQYGENTIPIIAYFVKNDIASIRARYLAEQKSDGAIAAAKDFWASLWQSEPVESPSTADKDKDTAQEQATYGPDLRGQRAIAFIAHEGHPFLGQFVLDPQGQAVWVQTERILDAAKSLFFSSAIDLEKKYKRGESLDSVDILSTGLDIFPLGRAFKAMKFLRATQKTHAVSVMRRTQLLGAPLLRKTALSRYLMKYGALAGTTYLVLRHPSLLSSILVTLGEQLGIPPFLAKLIGWGGLLVLLLLPLLSFLGRVSSAAGTVFSAMSYGIRWMRKHLSWCPTTAA